MPKEVWNKGLTKETDERLKNIGKNISKTNKRLHKEGKINIWNKGLTKETDERVRRISESKLGERNPMFGKPSWIKGLTKETDERVKKLSLDKMGGGNPRYGKKPWNYSLTKDIDERLKSQSERKMGIKNPMWKGDNVKYDALHAWIKRHKPKPKLCEYCGRNKPFDLANISGKYKRNVNDFEWLCRKCHMKKDGRNHKREDNPNWKGGLATDNKKEYDRIWRENNPNYQKKYYLKNKIK